jgi:hypothetical protein
MAMSILAFITGFVLGVTAMAVYARHLWGVYMEMHPDVKAVWEKSKRNDQ